MNTRIGMFTYSDDVDQIIPITSSISMVQMIASALQVNRDVHVSMPDTVHALKHIRTGNLFTSTRKVVTIFSNGVWQQQDSIRSEISELSQIGVDVISIVAGDDSSPENFYDVISDPSLVFYVGDDDFTALDSLAAMTKYYSCIDYIFDKRL